jgi:hypothetical protein
MVFLLAPDVVADLVEVARTDRASAIGGLPLEELAWGELVHGEVRRGAFDVFHQVGHGQGSG